MRWLVLDEVLQIEKGKRAITRSNVPSQPYSAELLMLEMMAQTGGLLLGAESDFSQDVIFAKIEKAEIAYLPPKGSPLLIECSSDGLRAEGAWMQAEIRHHDQVVSNARFMLVAVDRIIENRSESTTFHEVFMKHFDVRKKVTV